MTKRSIKLRHPAASARIWSGIAFLAMCVLVGLVAFVSGALIPLNGGNHQSTDES